MFALGLVGFAAAASTAEAKGKESFVFLHSSVDLGKGIPADLAADVKDRLAKKIAAHPDLSDALPKDAPDPKTEPKKLARYLAKRGIRVYRLGVKVSSYSEETEPVPGKTHSQYFTVRVGLELYADTYPKRTWAIDGSGSATVKLEVGKKVRPPDRKEGRAASLDEATDRAIDAVLAKLREPPPKQKKKRRKK